MDENLNFQNYPFNEKPPERWELTSLGKIVDGINPGFASGEHNRHGDGLPHLRPMNISPDGEIDLSDVRYVHPDKGKLRIKKGDILFNNTNSVIWVGKSAVNRENTEYAFSNHMTRVEVNENHVNSEFIARQLHYLSTSGYFQVHCKKHVNQASISSKVLEKSVPILLPPTNEQNRIVAKIEELQSHSRKAREALETIPDQLEQLRQSILAAAFRGDLTKKWREQHKGQIEPTAELLKRIRIERRKRWEAAELDKLKAKGLTGDQLDTQFAKRRKQYPEPAPVDTTGLPELPEGWCWASWDMLTSLVTSGSRGWADYYSTEGALFIRAQDINTDALLIDGVAHVSLPDKVEGLRTSVVRNDLLVTITGANVTKAAWVQKELEEAYVSQHVALVRPVDETISSLMHLWATSSAGGRGILLENAYGGGKPGLNLNNIRELVMPLPSKDEISRLIAHVKVSTARTKNIECYLTNSLKKAANFEQSILIKAFNGNLVPQDPNDEPASILLARLRDKRASALDKTRKRKPNKKGIGP